MLRIVADENMPALSLFDGIGQIITTPGRPLERALLKQADVLLVRSVTQVDGALLEGTPVRFVGSATIGTDHVALDELGQLGVCFAHAPGCNAMAVAEYVLQAILSWPPGELAGLTVGVIGMGNVGRRVSALVQALGMKVLAHDPWLEQAPAGATLVTLAQALAADVITLHVPLVDAGPHPTRHLLDGPRLAALGPQRLLINTSRGPVVDNTALLALLRSGTGPVTVLDVWETEPLVPPALLALAASGSPHVAGYSVEGKTRGTWMLYQALCQWCGEAASRPMPQLAPSRQWPHAITDTASMLAWLHAGYRLADDHQRLCEVVGLTPEGVHYRSEAERAAGFDLLRKRYPARHEMAGWQMAGAIAPAWQPVLSQLGAVLVR